MKTAVAKVKITQQSHAVIRVCFKLGWICECLLVVNTTAVCLRPILPFISFVHEHGLTHEDCLRLGENFGTAILFKQFYFQNKISSILSDTRNNYRTVFSLDTSRRKRLKSSVSERNANWKRQNDLYLLQRLVPQSLHEFDTCVFQPV